MPDVEFQDFHSETLEWLKNAELANRQALGQYMTPRFLRTYLLDQLALKPGDRVLDPAVGTGEFLRQALDAYPGIQATGWDIDPDVLSVAKTLVPEAKLVCRSGLESYDGEKFDFVIGNPPYFEMKLDEAQQKMFAPVIAGRPNIYALFFKVGLDALNDGGLLAFVVPPSMNAGAYFKNLRKYLTEENHLVSLRVFNDSSMFHDAQTSVQIIVVRKGTGKSNNTFLVEGENSNVSSLIFCEDPNEFRELYKDSVSLNSLGYEAVTGTTVWNQHKDKLTNLEDETTVPLLYARNITEDGIALILEERRPQFIRGGKTFSGPAIVVNRIIGGVGKGQIKSALLPIDYIFAAENHLNVIRPVSGREQKISLEKLFDVVNQPDIILKARTLTGNTQLSANEWNHLIPLSL
jgi:adenine-specific DNA-methyltransferase